MKKRILVMLVLVLFVFGLAACSGEGAEGADAVTEESGALFEEEGTFGVQAELTIFANGGTIWFGTENTYDAELSAATMDMGVTLAEAIGEEIRSVEKENAEFAGWTVYAVTTGEWVAENETELADGQLCVACGDYGYYLMHEYALVSENTTTDELLALECDGRSVYAFANWK